MSNNDKNIEINRQLIAVIDELLAAGNWEGGLFVKTASKRFRELRAQAEALLIETTGSGVISSSQDSSLEKIGYSKIYISVYQTEGGNLQKWHQTLKALSEHGISRPVYRTEEQVNAMIRTKADAQREGYVIILVKEENIINLQLGMPITDRLGNELLTLKPKAIQLENIVSFVHCEKQYQFCDESLVLKNE